MFLKQAVKIKKHKNIKNKIDYLFLNIYIFRTLKKVSESEYIYF